MPPGGANPTDASYRVADYCRAARRVRGRYARQPARLHRELRDLSRRHDSARTTGAVTVPASGRSEAFAEEVAARIEGPVLRHSQRRALLSAARRFGIGRFEANLIIAAVQHRLVSDAPSHAPRAHGGGASRFAPVALVLALQTLIAWGAWQVFFG